MSINTKLLSLFALGGLMTLLVACVEEDPNEVVNVAPEVATTLDDLQLQGGFGIQSIPLSSVFADADGDELSYSAIISDEQVATISVSASTLTITEVGPGTTTITVKAEDGNGGSAEASFSLTVEEVSDSNTPPELASAIPDANYSAGFQSASIELPIYFTDAETQMLMFGAASSDENVATVSVDGPFLTITEVAEGMTTVTVTASDGDGGSVSDDFVVTIEESSTSTCSNDNTISTTPVDCTENSSVANSYEESVSGDTRTITTNGIPNHTYNNQRPPGNDGTLNSSTNTYAISAQPELATSSSSVVNDEFRPQRKLGVALNGVPMDPAPAEPFIFENPSTGEYNWDWVMEPNNNKQDVELDCAAAHVQPDGTYHYHGDPAEYANTLLSGLGDGTTTPTSPVQVGWASDGYPVLYKYGPDAAGNLILLAPSYQLKSGDRPGDGISEPCGEYNGKYTNDYEYVSGLGDLDECNGVQQSITINDETFDYFYVITDSFPVMPRCVSGTPSNDFNLGG